MQRLPREVFARIKRWQLSGAVLAALLSTPWFCQLASAANVPPGSIRVTQPVYADEGRTFSIQGSFEDPDSSDAHTVSIFWEFGVVTTVQLAPGVLEFTASHVYYYDSLLPIYPLVQVSDDQGASDTGSFAVTVLNVAPTIDSVILNTNICNEGDALEMEVRFSDPGLYDYHRVEIYWGDMADRFDVQGRFFSRRHSFPDDTLVGSHIPIDEVTITIWDEFDYQTWRTNVVVRNVAPHLSDVQLAARVPAHSMGILKGVIEEPGPRDSLTLEIDWGDGTGTQMVAMEPGSTSFTVPHIFRTGGRRCDVQVAVRDDDGGNGRANVAVEIVAPHVMPPCPPLLRVIRRGTATCLEWDAPGVALQSAPTASGPWIDVPVQAASPFPLSMTENARFFRVRP
jgi:hypothetical protein